MAFLAAQLEYQNFQYTSLTQARNIHQEHTRVHTHVHWALAFNSAYVCPNREAQCPVDDHGLGKKSLSGGRRKVLKTYFK